MKKETLFLNKKNRVTYLNGFVLEGIVVDADDKGILLKTTQKTSFISWNSIRDIQPMEGA